MFNVLIIADLYFPNSMPSAVCDGNGRIFSARTEILAEKKSTKVDFNIVVYLQEAS
jgi:hypothetical protein